MSDSSKINQDYIALLKRVGDYFKLSLSETPFNDDTSASENVLTDDAIGKEFCFSWKDGLTMTIQLIPELEHLFWMVEVTCYERSDEYQVLRAIADANFFWQKTGGGTLSADLNHQIVYLGFYFSLNALEGDALTQALDQVIEWREYAQQMFAKLTA